MLINYGYFNKNVDEDIRAKRIGMKLPEDFSVDEVILCGTVQDYYKVYLLDHYNEKFIPIDLKVKYDHKNQIRAYKMHPR